MRPLLALVVLMVAGGAARAERRFDVGLRLGFLARPDAGYSDHAAAFGFGAGGEVAVAFGVSAGLRLAPRLRLEALTAAATSTSRRRADPGDELQVTNAIYVLELAGTVLRHEVSPRLSFELDLVVGGGVYLLEDVVESQHRMVAGPGATVGVVGSMNLGRWRFAAGYAYHHSRVRLADRFGGELVAGGHAGDLLEVGYRF